MLRRLVNWLLYFFGFKKREEKSALQSLLDLLPLIEVTVTLVGALVIINKELGPVKLSLRQLLIRKIKYYLRWLRVKLIGY